MEGVPVKRFGEWCAAHPRVLVLGATVLLVNAAYVYHRTLSWAEGIEQIEASEFFGG